jgi:hypothetical protein
MALLEAARGAYREQFERRAAKKRGGTGGRHAKATGTAQERSVIINLDDLPKSERSPSPAHLTAVPWRR